MFRSFANATVLDTSAGSLTFTAYRISFPERQGLARGWKASQLWFAKNAAWIEEGDSELQQTREKAECGTLTQKPTGTLARASGSECLCMRSRHTWGHDMALPKVWSLSTFHQ